MYESTTLNLMIASPHLANVLAIDVAMNIFAASTSVMSSLIQNNNAFPILLENSTAKLAIFNSSVLVNTMMTTPSSANTMSGLGISVQGPVPDAKIGPTQSLGVPGNIIILTARMGSIVATTLENTFFGDNNKDGVTFDVPGTHASSVYPVINLPFTDVYWDVKSIAATAAARVSITYVDFN
jgi:hypothetical protein